jgi:hypothetical protein
MWTRSPFAIVMLVVALNVRVLFVAECGLSSNSVTLVECSCRIIPSCSILVFGECLLCSDVVIVLSVRWKPSD